MLHSSISLAINAAQALRGHTPLVVKPLRILALPLKPLRVFRGGAANHVQHRILFIMCPITGTIGPILFDKIADASSLNPCRVSIRAGMVTERKPRLVAGADHIGTDWQTTPAQLIGGVCHKAWTSRNRWFSHSFCVGMRLRYPLCHPKRLS